MERKGDGRAGKAFRRHLCEPEVLPGWVLLGMGSRRWGLLCGNISEQEVFICTLGFLQNTQLSTDLHPYGIVFFKTIITTKKGW